MEVFSLALFLLISLTPKHIMVGHMTSLGCGWNGKMGASGITYDCKTPIAAHKTFPFGTIVRVTNIDPKSKLFKKSTVVLIYERGPYGAGRVLDAQPVVVNEIAGKGKGGVRVKLEVLSSKYACNGFKCLKKKFGSSNIPDNVLLEMKVME